LRIEHNPTQASPGSRIDFLVEIESENAIPKDNGVFIIVCKTTAGIEQCYSPLFMEDNDNDGIWTYTWTVKDDLNRDEDTLSYHVEIRDSISNEKKSENIELDLI